MRHLLLLLVLLMGSIFLPSCGDESLPSTEPLQVRCIAPTAQKVRPLELFVVPAEGGSYQFVCDNYPDFRVHAFVEEGSNKPLPEQLYQKREGVLHIDFPANDSSQPRRFTCSLEGGGNFLLLRFKQETADCNCMTAPRSHFLFEP